MSWTAEVHERSTSQNGAMKDIRTSRTQTLKHIILRADPTLLFRVLEASAAQSSASDGTLKEPPSVS